MKLHQVIQPSVFKLAMIPIAVAVACVCAASAYAADVTTDRIVRAASEPQNWLTNAGDYNSTRYSSLKSINAGNVKNLKLAFSVALGGIEPGGIWPHGGLEATPLVEDGMMYVTDGWGSVYKLDVREGRGKLLWKMDPETDKDWAGAVTCCGVNNRGVALWQGYVISHTLDGRLVVTNKETGKIEWQRKVADPAVAETITAAPLLVKDMVITGVAGAEYGIRGWIAATDLKTKKEVWRRYTIPAPGEPGHETWADDHQAWKNGGGSTWITGSYDAANNTIIWGTGNPGPDWDPEYRPGDNLYTNSALALDADTGEIKWHFQYTPNDSYDYDAVSEHVLTTIPVAGAQRKVALHANRNGYAYALDRETGKFIWGTAFVKKINWTKGLDPKTGMPLEYDPKAKLQVYQPGTQPLRGSRVGIVCPGNMGGKNWPPTAFSPSTNYWYIPVIESCNTLTNQKAEPGKSYKKREFFTGGGPSQHQPITGSITAIDVKTGNVVGKHETAFPLLGGMLATGGGLVFTGEPSGEFMALDAKTLEKRWSVQLGAGINAPPMTYSVNGKQYVALLVGLGGAWPKWFIDGTKGLEKVAPGSTLFVFAL